MFVRLLEWNCYKLHTLLVNECQIEKVDRIFDVTYGKVNVMKDIRLLSRIPDINYDE